MTPRLLIIGCGDVGLRVLKLLAGRWRVFALTSRASRAAELRAAGAVPLVGNLDEAVTLARLAGLADLVLHLAPPARDGDADLRTRNLLTALARRPPAALVYASTTGVYGDCAGALIDETRALEPATDRARRRVDAEAQLRAFGRRHGTRISLLRIPGIYARDREGGHPRERLARGTPVLRREDDVYTNHIHADDLAQACLLALLRGLPQRAVNVCDDSQLLMGEYFDLAADLGGLPRPERITRAEAAERMSAMQLSFWSESRRLSNARLRRELRLALRYSTPKEGL
ncbi:NAD-dependent epimerase/dehydratase family protein [Pelomonas sp. Root1217]|uniref:NAD-dependent epimerase/dehydratase family protein n=1 Tax=Pelomonas sp. Root1217 TaxID=1736430 RepID=UPI000A8D53E1|nr:NAD-dependent epimerase/dehydratase family protein [Pelomonas sp. Root1217]